MKDALIKLAAAQYPLTFFSDWKAYCEHLERWVKEAVDQNADILLFPEYASMEIVSLFPEKTRGDLQLQIREMQNLLPQFRALFENLAASYDCCIIAPAFPVFIAGKYVNRTYVFDPSGEAGFQDKWFMTRFENEKWGISEPERKIRVFEFRELQFAIQTCYDIEFAVGSNQACLAGAQVIFVPSCTEGIRGANRVHIGARARAMENQCYTLVSQTIKDAEWSPAVDINYGFTAFYASPDHGFPEDGILARNEAQKAGWLVVEADLSLLQHVRNEGQVLNFKDHAQVRMLAGQESV